MLGLVLSLLSAVVSAGAQSGADDALLLVQAGLGTHSAGTYDAQDFSFVRTVSFIEPNGSVNFNIGHGCRVVDRHGSNDCSLAWLSQNDALIKLHLASGIHPGDKLSFMLTSNAMTHNNAEPGLANVFDGDAFEVTGSCQLCEGSCSASFRKLSSYIDVQLPTFIDDRSVCDSLGNVTDMVLLNTSQLPPGPFGLEFNVMYLKLTGDLQYRIALESGSGAKRVDETLSFGLGRGQAPPVSMLQVEQQQQLQLQRHRQGQGQGQQQQRQQEQQQRQEEQSLSGAFRKAWGETMKRTMLGLTRKPAALRALKGRKAAGSFMRKVGNDGLSGVRARLKVWYFENGQNENISIHEDKFCKKLDDRGSVDCFVPFGSSLSLKASAHLGALFDEGSTVDLKLEPKIEGALGSVLGSLLPAVKKTLPLCGQKQTLELFGQVTPYQPAKCGFYGLNSNLSPMHFTLPELPSTLLLHGEQLHEFLPFLPKNLAQLPPFSIGASLTLKHKDNEPILSVKAEVGLE